LNIFRVHALLLIMTFGQNIAFSYRAPIKTKEIAQSFAAKERVFNLKIGGGHDEGAKQ
jgi:hypothetical protein